MLTSRLHETWDHTWSLTFAFHIIITRAPVIFTWAEARVCPRVATPLLIPPPLPHHIQSITHKEGRELNKFMPIVTLSFLSVPILTLCTGLFFLISLLVGGVSALFDWQKYSFTTGFAKSFSKNYYKFKNEIEIPTTVFSMDS